MRRRFLFVVPLLVVACTHGSGDDPTSAEANATEGFTPYASDVRPGLHRLEPLDPLGASVADLGSAARDQGKIASCASFSFLGLIENQMYNERGITPDLSERYMIYSNFLQTGTLGGSPAVIAKFSDLTDAIGVLPEGSYPYAGVNANAHRFDQDAAQGLTTPGGEEVMLADAIAGTSDSTKERSDIVSRAEYLGALPAGPYPVTLPLKATLQPRTRMPEVEFEGKIVPCFAEDPDTAPKKISVTPREALKMCFDLDPSRYFTCDFDLGTAAAAAEAQATGDDQCSQIASAADYVGKAQYEANAKSLELALALLDRGDAALLGLTVPGQGQNVAPVWSTKRDIPAGGGHAVVAVGFVTADEIGDVREQSRGVLANGLFDKLAAMVEPAYAEKLAAGLPSDPAQLRDVRASSVLGQRAAEEGGLVVFRNSWGAPVGVQGHQAMTFDFYLRNGMLVQGRTQPRLPGVAWNGRACPATNLSYGGDWLRTKALPKLQSHYRAKFVPAECAPK